MATTKLQTIKDLREARKLSTAELGRQAGTDASTILKWESSPQAIDVAKLPPLAKALGVTPADIGIGENRRHLVNHGYWFVLAANGHPGTGFTAKIAGVSTEGAKAWAHRPLLPEHPHGDAPSILIQTTEGGGATAAAALDDLAGKIDEIMNRALWPERLPDDPEDWEPKEAPAWYQGPGRRR